MPIKSKKIGRQVRLPKVVDKKLLEENPELESAGVEVGSEIVEVPAPEPVVEVKPEPSDLVIRGGRKFRKVVIQHKSGDVTTQLELVE